jgi:hypothetical protein
MSGETAFHGMLIFVVAFLAFLAVIFFLRHREAMSRHQERLAAIDKGISVPVAETRPSRSPRIYLLRGLQWFFVGVGISLVLLSISTASREPISLASKLSMAQMLKAQGASEAQIAEYMKSAAGEMEGMPYSAASIGLVPMSVGLAYLIFYRKESEIAEPREAK